MWVEQRRFILRHLRDFGFGRTDMAVQIEFEATQLVKYYNGLIEEKANSFRHNKPLPTKETRESGCVAKSKNGQIYQLAGEDDLGKNTPKSEEEEEPVKRAVTAEDFYVKVGDDLEIRRAAKLPGVIVEMEDFFGVPVLNTLWCMMAGKRFVISRNYYALKFCRFER